MPAVDILEDYAARILDAARNNGGTLDEAAVQRVSDAIRHEYAGERLTIGKTSAKSLRDISARNRAMYADYRRGVHVPALMRKYGITSRWGVYKILNQFKVRPAFPEMSTETP